MKFIDLTTKYKVDKERLKIGISVAVILLISAISVVAVKTLIDSQEAKEKAKENAMLVSILDNTDAEDLAEKLVNSTSESETSESTEESVTEDTTTPSETIFTSEESTVDETGLEVEIPAETVENIDSTGETKETKPAPTATSTPTPMPTATPAPTPTPKPSYSESKISKQVYASCKLNVRSGPGTEYSTVKTIEKGSAIDVIGVTDTGWYHTYNGNWVIRELCQDTPPVVQATPTPVPQQKPQTTQATNAPASTTAAASNNGMVLYGSCTITFYGPQKTSSGGLSTTTATGTTCTQGVTCAADWSIFPAGTVIYIENDPLGGDGYYTVEDKGSAVKGAHIDVYADDGESNNYSTTTRNVYIVK